MKLVRSTVTNTKPDPRFLEGFGIALSVTFTAPLYQPLPPSGLTGSRVWVVRAGDVSPPPLQLSAATLNESKLIGRAVLPESCLTNTPIFVMPAAPNVVALTGTAGPTAVNVVPS